jgi:hypothetical protein
MRPEVKNGFLLRCSDAVLYRSEVVADFQRTDQRNEFQTNSAAACVGLDGAVPELPVLLGGLNSTRYILLCN